MSRWTWLALFSACTDDAGVLSPPTICGGTKQTCCGDGVVDDGEACDDGIFEGRYGGCLPGCVRAPFCGDGRIDAGERCDDGAANVDQAGACRTSCQPSSCDDGFMDRDEACIGRTFFLDGRVGDYTGDGLADVLVAEDRVARLLVNRGDGSLVEAFAVTTALNQDYASWWMLDLDGRDPLDLAALDTYGIVTFLGRDRPSFGTPVRSELPEAFGPAFHGPWQHVNDDGLLDLVREPNAEPGYGAVVALNDGAGSFIPTATMAAPQFFFFQEAADVDGDGLRDLLFQSTGAESMWARGVGNGAFGELEPLLGPEGPGVFFPAHFGESRGTFLGHFPNFYAPMQYEGGALAEVGPRLDAGVARISDFDADGIDELVVRRASAVQIVSLPDARVLSERLAPAGWTFVHGSQILVQRGVEYDAYPVSTSYVIGDAVHHSLDASVQFPAIRLDADALDDFRFRRGVMRGLHEPTAVVTPLSYAVPRRVALADVDGGGADAIVQTNLDVLLWMRGNGSGAFGDRSTILPASAHAFSVMDWNGDAQPDLAVVASNEVAVLVNEGGTFSRAVGRGISGVFVDLLVGDLAAGAEPDVAYGSERRIDILSGPMLERVGVLDLDSRLSGMTAADTDGEGSHEIHVIHEETSMLATYAGGTLISKVPTSTAPRAITSADMDGDGRSDLVIACAGGAAEIHYASGDVATIPLLFRPSGVRAADVDRDGDQDLVVLVIEEPEWAGGDRAYFSSYVIVVIQRDGSFVPSRPFLTRGLAAGFDVGDLNDDGAFDVLVAGLADENPYVGPEEPSLVTYLAHP